MRLIVRAFFLWGWGIDAPPIHTHGIFSLFSPNTLNDGPLLDTKISNFNLMEKKNILKPMSTFLVCADIFLQQGTI